MKKYSCVFRNCNTVDAPGKGELPPSCKAKGCTGEFSERPSCRTFMHDLLEPETHSGILIYDIRAARERRRHEFVLKAPEQVPAHAVLKTARA